MHIIGLPLLIIAFPVIFQLYFGSNRRRNSKLPFWAISSISVFLEIVFIPLGFYFSLKVQMANGVISLSPGFLIFVIPFLFALIMLIFYQKAQSSVDNS